MSDANKQRRRIAPRFSIKSLIGLTFIVALLMYFPLHDRELRKQHEFLSNAQSVVFAHEIDEEGNRIANPKMPGPEWLRNVVGDHWLLTPIELKVSLREKDPRLKVLSQLTQLKRLEVKYDGFATDSSEPKLNLFEAIGKLQKLESLRVPIQQYDYDRRKLLTSGFEVDFKPLTRLSRLRELEITGSGQPLDTESLAQLIELESLNVAFFQKPDDMKWVRGMKKLKFLDCRWAVTEWFNGPVEKTTPYPSWDIKPLLDVDLSPLGELHNLERLELVTDKFDTELFKTTKLTLESVFIPGRQQAGFTPNESLYKHKLRRPLLDRTDDMGRLHLTECNVSDLDFIPTDFQVRSLLLNGNQISDIEPLRWQTEVERCDLSNNPIVDITPLESMTKLKFIDLNGTNIRNVPKFSSRLISFLELSETQIEGLDLPEHEHGSSVFVNLSGTAVRDLTKLPKHLKSVNLSETNVTDFSALKDWSKIEELTLDNTSVEDLSSFPDLPLLTDLSLQNTPLKSLDGIEKFPKLEWLKLSNTKIRNLSPLAKLKNLDCLYLDGTQVKDISPVKKMRKLRLLNLSNTQVTDLEPLRGLILSSLSLTNTPVSNIEPLKELVSIKHVDPNAKLGLWLDGTQVTDLSVLEGSELKSLNISNTAIKRFQLPANCSFTFYARDCPNFRLANGDFESWNLSVFLVDCIGLDDLSVIANSGASYLSLQNVQPKHDLSWLQETPNLKKLTFLGAPIELDPDKRGIQLPKTLQVISVPLGSIVSEKLKDQLPQLRARYNE